MNWQALPQAEGSAMRETPQSVQRLRGAAARKGGVNVLPSMLPV
jgi:hypothetical protein